MGQNAGIKEEVCGLAGSYSVKEIVFFSLN